LHVPFRENSLLPFPLGDPPFTVSSSETEVFLAEETAFSSVSFYSTFWDIKEAKIELEIRVLSKEEE
jgi:hypothetical protein